MTLRHHVDKKLVKLTKRFMQILVVPYVKEACVNPAQINTEHV